MQTYFRDVPEAHQLPNGVREAMLQAGAGKGLIVLEALYMLRFEADRWLSFGRIYTLLRDNFGCSYQLIYQGLQHRLIFQRRKDTCPKAGKAGARHYLYRIPHPDEIIVEYAPDKMNTPSDILCKDDLKSLKGYRLALHRELFIRYFLASKTKGFMMARGLMADRLGVSERTIRTYDKILGHDNTPNFRERLIHQDNWYYLPRYKNKFDTNGKRLSSRVWLQVHDHQKREIRTLPYVRYLAYKEMQAGHDVFAVERLPNTYYPYPKPDVSQLDSWDALAHYWVELKALNQAGFFQNQDGGWYHQRE